MEVIDRILTLRLQRHQLALLLDPEKFTDSSALDQWVRRLTDKRLYREGVYMGPDYLFVGGSTGSLTQTFVSQLKRWLPIPVVLFPGNTTQFAPNADALLFLSVLSSRHPDLLVGNHIAIARQVKASGIETIPMGYILIDGGCPTSVAEATHSLPLAQDDVSAVVDTAVAAELLGKRLVYLEAGSGARIPVATEIIAAVRHELSIPLIVGGGIRTIRMMQDAYHAGADIVVIGNHFEQHPDEIIDFCHARFTSY